MGYIKVPEKLDFETLEHNFGRDATVWYMERIKERIHNGAIYFNPLKTIYIWATKDKETHQGFWTTYHGHKNSRKKKNYGRS